MRVDQMTWKVEFEDIQLIKVPTSATVSELISNIALKPVLHIVKHFTADILLVLQRHRTRL